MADGVVGPGSRDDATTTTVDYRALFDRSPHAALILARDLRVVDANEALLRLTRRTREEVVGAGLFHAFPRGLDDDHRRQAEELKRHFEQVFATGEADSIPLFRYPIPFSTAEGDGFVDVAWSTSQHPLRDAAGHVELIVQFVRTVTEPDSSQERLGAPADGRKVDEVRRGVAAAQVMERAQAMQSASRVSESERLQLLRLFDQSLSFTVFMRQPSHVVELANPAYLRMVGETDLRDRSYGSAHVGDPPVPVNLLDAVYESGNPIVEQGMPLRVPDGRGGTQTIYVDVVIQQIVDANGQVAGVFMQGNDVTLSKATSDELAAYRTRLEEMVAERTRALERSEAERHNAEAALHRAQRLEAVGKLTGGVAHDFNNVLQIVRGNLQLLERRLADDPQVASRLTAALQGVERGAKLAAQLLAFGRRQPLEPVVVDLRDVVQRMEDMLHRALGESIEISLSVVPDLWNTLIDVPRLENVILNIAINARDAMDHRGRLTMELANASVDEMHARGVDGLSAGDYVTIAISDTGGGMSPEVQQRAFEPFFTTKPEGEGTGLGLSMVYGFLKQSGGHVSLYSEVGSGTTIRLYMPRSQEPVSAPVTAPTTAPPFGNGETILVVEDDDAVRETVVDTLIELGYRVLRAVDGQSALTIVRSGVAIDLLFTDVIMPGPVSSTEMVRLVGELAPHIQVLFTSGFTRDAIVQQDRLQTGVNLLSKPYGREELSVRLRQLLGAGHLPTDPPPYVPSSPESTPPMSDPVLASSARRVLLVEDNDEVRETTTEFINEVGFAVVAVVTAEAALDELAKNRYDVVFTDVSLPGMSGIELTKRLLQADPAQRIVIATGYGADLGRSDFGPGVAVLGKPYDLDALERTLDAVLDAKVEPAGGGR